MQNAQNSGVRRSATESNEKLRRIGVDQFDEAVPIEALATPPPKGKTPGLAFGVSKAELEFAGVENVDDNKLPGSGGENMPKSTEKEPSSMNVSGIDSSAASGNRDQNPHITKRVSFCKFHLD
jgi:hypothetical protein